MSTIKLGVVWFLYIEVVLYIREDSNVQPCFGSPGEQHFLFGSYSESAQTWRAELWAERERGEKDSLVDMCGFGGQFESKGVTSCSPDGPRSAFLETRLLLSLLYGLLFQYRLKEAQGLGDHMARLLLHQAGPHGDDSAHNTGVYGSWSIQVHWKRLPPKIILLALHSAKMQNSYKLAQCHAIAC